ncbi:MAG: DUF2442 domain-containing protein [Calditrichota bacterium]
MIKITGVEYAGGYRLRLQFENGVEGVLDIARQVNFEGVFKPLANLEFFKRVRINKTWGTIEWPGKIDLDPEVLYEEVTGKPLAWAGKYREVVEA